MTGSSRAVFILKFFGISESAWLVLKTGAQLMFMELQSRRTVFNTDKTSEGFSFFSQLKWYSEYSCCCCCCLLNLIVIWFIYLIYFVIDRKKMNKFQHIYDWNVSSWKHCMTRKEELTTWIHTHIYVYYNKK